LAPRGVRLNHIDWLRGLAVVIMIEAHTVDAWVVSDALVRDQPRYKMLQFLAGWAAPLFLFLAGVSVSLAAASHLRKGKSIAEASWLVQKRGWQVLLLAYLFRLQSFMLSPTSNLQSLLKVDILNVMGVTMVMAAWCWARGRTVREAAVWLLVPALLCVILSQFAMGWSWPLILGDRLQGYVRSVGDNANFSVLPWGAFIFAGAWLGRIFAEPRDSAADRALHIRIAVAGIVIFAAAFAGSYAPPLTPLSHFWTNSTSFFLLRIGVMLASIALAWLWMQRPTANRWSPILVFGKTSLFIYWIHVEIVYGVLTYPIRHELSIAQWAIAYAAFTTLMLGAAIVWQRRDRGPLVPESLRVPLVERPS
jgi:uncharacterized membrane protein